MKVRLNARNRALLGMAIEKYERLAKGTKANLNTLNLPDMAVQTALGCCDEIKTRMATAAGETDEPEPVTEQSTVNIFIEVEFAHDLVVTVKDACNFVLGKYAKLEDTQIEMLTPITETQQTVTEVNGLMRLFETQLELAGG